MLSKLLKYELRASGRILLPVYALLLASAGCCSLFYKLAADHPYRTGAASVLMGLLMMAFWIFVVATGAITALLMIYRFYKNYMTDEGYLMFTLPVNRHQLIWAKLLSALLYTAASAVAVTLSILLVLLPIADWSGFWGDLGELLSSITESLHFGVPGPLLLLWIAVLAILRYSPDSLWSMPPSLWATASPITRSCCRWCSSSPSRWSCRRRDCPPSPSN